MLEIGKSKFLVTAGHVIMNQKFNYLYVPNRISEGFTFLNGVWFPSDQKENIGLDSDDFAYLLLDNETTVKLENEGYEFSKVSELDLNHIPSENCIYTLLGFRYKKTVKKGIDRYVRKEIITNFGLSKSYYKDENNSDRKILIANARKLITLDSGQKGKTGNLKGMSGGPIWHTSLSAQYSPTNPTVKLVGIMHEFGTDRIIGTKINRLIEIMKKRKQIHEIIELI